MARVTVEDCVDKVPNRFELLLIAAHRARQLAKGAPMTVEADDDKNPVVALREIAEKTISAADMRESLIHSIQKQVEMDEPEVAAAPLAPLADRLILGRDSQSADTTVDTMSEADLLRAFERLAVEDPTTDGSGRSRFPERGDKASV